jgi:hypothetical protein
LEIRTWGIEWKIIIDKTDEWAVWWLVNVKIDKENIALLKQTINIPKEDMEYYHWAMFTHAIEFFKECMNLNKLILKHFFTSLFNYLSTKDIVTLANLLST